MRRDFDLIRVILLAVENGAEVSSGDIFAALVDKVEEAHFSYNLEMVVKEAQLLRGYFVPDKEDEDLSHWVDLKLTWPGHDYLDSVRDDQIWAAAKDGAKQAGGLTFDLLRSLAKGLLKKKIEHHTGVALDI